MSKNKTNFDKLILKSVQESNHIIPNKVYYDNAYSESLKKELNKRKCLEKFGAREFTKSRTGLIKICSIASSSRLCFLYFANKNVSFEKELLIGVNSRTKAHLDAYDNKNTYYECKCHEIFDNHNTKKNHLRLSYKKLIKECFNISYPDNNDEYLMLKLSDFGIQKDTSIYYLEFDMKQFLCHLMGLANNGGGKLQYVFFTPSVKEIELNALCKEVYSTLHNEIDEIWNCSVIKNMCNKYNITLLKPMEVPVSDIDDFVLSNII